MKTPLLLIGTAFFVTACGGTKKDQPKNSESKNAIEIAVEKVDQPWYEGEIPLIFNVAEEYPETDIRLSDLSDALYIPLETRENLLLVQRGTCEGNEYFLAEDCIYAQEEQSRLYVFKRDGRFVRKIDRQGGGPEEYSYISSYVVDTLRKEIFIHDGYLRKGRTIVYDLEGNFKRSFSNPAKEIASLNDSLLVNFVCFFPEELRYSVIRKDNGAMVKKMPIRFNIQLPHDSHGRLSYGSLVKSPKGVFMANLGNDTIFEIRNDLKVYPRIIDQSDYGTNFAQVHPTIETAHYLMFYILRCHNYKPYVDQHFYIYDKKSKQIYKMKEYKEDDGYWVLMDDYPHITNWEKVQNGNVAVRSRLADALFQAEGKHGDAQLKKIIETLDEDANPVLQVMIFRDADRIQR